MPAFFLRPLWTDEIVTYITAFAAPSFDRLIEITQASVHPPLYSLFARAWSHFAGISSAAMRSPSLFFGLLSMPLIYLAGRKLFHQQAVGIAAALLTAFSVLHIHYSMEARPYSMLFVLGVLLTFSFVRFVQQHGRYRWWLLLFTATTIAACYIHYSAIIFAAASYVALLGIITSNAVRRALNIRQLKGADAALSMVSIVAVVAAYAPWLPVVFREYLPWFQELALARDTAGAHPFALFNWIAQLFWLSETHIWSRVMILTQTIGVAALALFVGSGLRKLGAVRVHQPDTFRAVAALLVLSALFLIMLLFSPLAIEYTTISARHIMIAFPAVLMALAWMFANMSAAKARIYGAIFSLTIAVSLAAYYVAGSQIASQGWNSFTDELARSGIDADRVLIDGNVLDKIGYNFFAAQKHLPEGRLIHYLPEDELEAAYHPLVPTPAELLHELYVPKILLQYNPIEFAADLKRLIDGTERIYVIEQNVLKRRTLQWLCWNNWQALDITRLGPREGVLMRRCSDDCAEPAERCIPLLP